MEYSNNDALSYKVLYDDVKDPVVDEDYKSYVVDDSGLIREYESWEVSDNYTNGKYMRHYNSYVFDSSTENIDIEYLLDIDLSNYSDIVETSTEYSRDIVLNDIDDSKYREVIVTHQNMEDIENDTSVFWIVVLEILWLVVLFVLDGCFFGEPGN